MSESEFFVSRICFWLKVLCKIHVWFDDGVGFIIAERLANCEMLLFPLVEWNYWRQIRRLEWEWNHEEE